MSKDQQVWVSRAECTNCSSKIPIQLPTYSKSPSASQITVPDALVGLTPAAAAALSPFDIDIGYPTRSSDGGYRIKMGMIRFKWTPKAVPAKIKLLPQNEHAATNEAYHFLMKSQESSYAEFVGEHNEFLKSTPNADERQRRRRLEYIERVGLECALWPHLFWNFEMTYTYERTLDCRRRQHHDDLDEADDNNAFDRHSIRKRFCTLALGPVVGYADSMEKIQFVYDLMLWTSVGAKANTGQKDGVPLSIMLASQSFSPEYWKWVRYGLIDLTRQVGYPTAMATQSEREELAVYPHCVRHTLALTGRSRMGLPVEETLAECEISASQV